MKTITTLFISIFLITLTSFSAAAPKTKDVNVVNTPNVNVLSIPPVEATITDPVEVIVNEMPGVMIENGPDNSVPVTVLNDKDNVEKFVFFNVRLTPAESGEYFFPNPEEQILILTDIVIQNRAPGDLPVAATSFSRVFSSAIQSNNSGQNYFLTVVGNQTLNLHFETGLRVETALHFNNVPNSTAPFIEILATGYLARKP